MLNRAAGFILRLLLRLKPRRQDPPVIDEPARAAALSETGVTADEVQDEVTQPVLPMPRSAARPFPGCAELRTDLVRLQEYACSEAWLTASDFLVLPEGAHRWGPYWRVFLHVSTNPPHSIGLELHGDVRLGRGTWADFDLTYYGGHGLGVSREHALLSIRSHALTITDLYSANGTIVNSAYLIPGQPFELFDGDCFSLGNLVFLLSVVYRPDPEPHSSRSHAD